MAHASGKIQVEHNQMQFTKQLHKMACLAGLGLGVLSARGAGIVLTRAPDDGLQPQALAGSDGTIHLLYFKGNPATGDVFYVRRAAGAEAFGKPIRVNSQPGAAIAIGTIRGAQIALGKGGRVHVAWNGSGKAAGRQGAPMFYTRLDDQHLAFEPERDVMTFSSGLDGGGSVAADEQGNVYVAWHGRATEKTEGEANRAVFLAVSTNEGRTFAREQRVNPEPTGACGCCGLKAFADRERNLYLLYREARDGTERDEILLASKDLGKSFRSVYDHPWKSTTCPMSSAWLGAAGANRTVAAWETKGQVWFTTIDVQDGQVGSPVAPAGGGGQKHPVAVANAQGETLLVWAEGTGWQKGGAVSWQLFDAQGKPKGMAGRKEGIPAWSFAATLLRRDGKFEIVY